MRTKGNELVFYWVLQIIITSILTSIIFVAFLLLKSTLKKNIHAGKAINGLGL